MKPMDKVIELFHYLNLIYVALFQHIEHLERVEVIPFPLFEYLLSKIFQPPFSSNQFEEQRTKTLHCVSRNH